MKIKYININNVNSYTSNTKLKFNVISDKTLLILIRKNPKEVSNVAKKIIDPKYILKDIINNELDTKNLYSLIIHIINNLKKHHEPIYNNLIKNISNLDLKFFNKNELDSLSDFFKKIKYNDNLSNATHVNVSKILEYPLEFFNNIKAKLPISEYFNDSKR